MLVLARKLSETIRIGDTVTVTIVQIRPGRVRLGIEAPSDVRIRREEIDDPSRDVEHFEFEIPAGAGY